MIVSNAPLLDDHILPSVEQILTCDGAVRASDAEPDLGSVPYEAGAIIPRGGWRCPVNAERPNRIRVHRLKLPDAILSPLRELDLTRITCQNEADEAASCSRYRAATSEFTRHLEVFADEPASISVLGISVKMPGLATVTVDQKKGRRIGLHLDVWDRRSLAEKICARWRININLGSEPRFLVFCNLPVSVMHSRLVLDPKTVGTAIGRQFFARCPLYPLFQLAISPGEAYLAPTDFLIHDATTLGKTKPDLSIAVLGHFRSTSEF